MFELTDTLTYAVPVMLAVLVAKTVADALEPKGIYDLVIECVTFNNSDIALFLIQLRLSQLPYLDAKHEYLWGNLQIIDVVRLMIYSCELCYKYHVWFRLIEMLMLCASTSITR
jgi:hypothetical protein